MQCSPSFDCNWGKQNNLTIYRQQLHSRYRVFSKGNVKATLQIALGGGGGGGHRNPKLRGRRRHAPP